MKKVLLQLGTILAGFIFVMATGLYAYLHHPLNRIASDLENVDSISFFAIGDQGSGFFKQWKVARAMESLAEKQGGLDFVMLMGDNFYSKTIASLDSIEWLSRFELVYSGKHLSAVPFYAILGNHDHGIADGGEEINEEAVDGQSRPAWPNPSIQIEYSRTHQGSNRWRMPDWYYSADFGRFQGKPLLRVVFIDTNLKHEDLLKEADFIKERFRDSTDAPVWKIVVGHHPIRNFGKHHHDESELPDIILPAMQEAKVDLYLSGHDHNQQVITKRGEPIYFISGAGGASLYQVTNPSQELAFSRVGKGFLSVKLDKNTLQIGHYDTDSNPVATYKIERSCNPGNPECLTAFQQ